MYCHVYHKGVAFKGTNDVASQILKTLANTGIMRKGEKRGELNIVFDNCLGQNKNNTVVLLIPYLDGLPQGSNFVFFVVGHTKNAADMLLRILFYGRIV